MNTMTKYRTLFYEKLAKTDNMDDAFIKAVWIAYLDGVEAGKQGKPLLQKPMNLTQRLKLWLKLQPLID